VSELPNGWVQIPLGEALQIQKGKKPIGLGPKSEDRVVLYINISAFETKRVEEFAPEQDVPRCQPSDTVLVWDGARAGLAGRGVGGFVGSTLARLTSDLVDPSYLYYFVHSNYGYLNTHTKGVGIPHIDPVVLANISFLLPPLFEQVRIVTKLEELLSDLDAGVVELKAAQKKLAQYRQSLLKAAVEGVLTAQWRANNKPTETGAQLLERILQERRTRWEVKQLAKFKEQGKAPPKDWQKKYPEPVQPDTTDLPELPQGWVWASVEQLSESVRNGLSKTPNTEQRGYPIFKINAVRPMAVNFTAIKHIEINASEAADYWVEVGDVLATRYNGSVDLLGVFGMVKNVPQSTLHPDKLIRMKPLTGAELGAWMEVCGNVGLSRKHLVARVKTTAGQTGISGEDLKRTPIPLPPVAEQKIALAVLEERLKAINELELPTELGLKQSTAQRQNILKAAFSGQLVAQDPSDESASELLARIRAERAAQQALKKPRARKMKEAA
jgi:type I restriction enzyme S subunit